MRLAVTTTTALAAIMALAPTVFAAPGATVENFCNFPISFYGDFGGSTVADVVSGTIDPGMTYYENYNPHAGRALHFWPTGQSASVLLVFGYTVDSSTPFVWFVFWLPPFLWPFRAFEVTGKMVEKRKRIDSIILF
jgi:hypothetical protein